MRIFRVLQLRQYYSIFLDNFAIFVLRFTWKIAAFDADKIHKDLVD